MATHLYQVNKDRDNLEHLNELHLNRLDVLKRKKLTFELFSRNVVINETNTMKVISGIIYSRSINGYNQHLKYNLLCLDLAILYLNDSIKETTKSIFNDETFEFAITIYK